MARKKKMRLCASVQKTFEEGFQEFIIALREDPNINDVSLGTYARDLKTILRFFIRCE